MELSQQEKDKIEQSRRKALRILRNKRGEPLVNSIPISQVDSEGGFILEEESQGGLRNNFSYTLEEAPDLSQPYKSCSECGSKFSQSFIQQKFGVSICKECSDKDEKFSLITKTEAKRLYLLSDGQLKELKYIEKKNPKQAIYHPMQLFLLCQVEEKSFSRWGDLENLQMELDRRAEAADALKQKRYEKKLIDMKKRSRLGSKYRPAAMHVHIFEENGDHLKKCTTCGCEIEYETL